VCGVEEEGGKRGSTCSVPGGEAQGQAVVLDKGPDPPSPPTRRDTFQVFFGGGREEHVPALRKLTVQRCVHVGAYAVAVRQFALDICSSFAVRR